MKFLKWTLILGLGLVLSAFMANKQIMAKIDQPLQVSSKYRDGTFHNASVVENAVAEEESFSIRRFVSVMKRFSDEDRVGVEPKKALPMKPVTAKVLDALTDDELHIVKLGHSSILLKVYGKYWLIDPMFSDRASPFQFVGPKRYQQTPMSIDELPPIERVLVSHNHYDHLDKATIEHLVANTQQFFVPLGVEGDLIRWGVDPAKIKSFDWWDEHKTDTDEVVFTPTQHFSGRALTDRNSTLWGSWVIKAGGQSLYFSGDSGYFKGFKEIGDKYGPFDLTMIETGAYNQSWNDIHMFPEQSVQAHIDLQGVTMLPIHNSTFDLSLHTWYDPLDRVSAAAKKQQVQLTTPIVGEIFTAKQAAITKQWWFDYK